MGYKRVAVTGITFPNHPKKHVPKKARDKRVKVVQKIKFR